MTTFDQISHETMVFMRGSYRLDEIGDGKDELKFKQGKKTILTVYTREDRFVFLIIFGKQEREIFDAQRNAFSPYIQNYYDNSRTYHDGKWMFIEVTALEQLNEVKKLIFIKKKPNRKPFPGEGAVYGKCGHRCDLCVHYTGISEELRQKMIPHLIRVWRITDWNMRCSGCGSVDWYCKDELCDQMKCALEKGLSACVNCKHYPCINATVGDRRSMIHTDVYSADDITWAILPYTPWQYAKKK